MNILNTLLEAEDDRKRRADLTYSEKTKGKGADKIVDRVIVNLAGNESGVWVRNLRMWNKLKTTMDRMKSKKDQLETKFKGDAVALFAAEDEVLTRVVEAAEFSLLLKKQVMGDDKNSTDYEAIVKELTDTMPELVEKLTELQAKYTSVIKGTKPATPTMTISKDDLKEGLVSDTLKAFKSMAAEFVKSFKLWGKSYDKKLNALKKRAMAK